MTLTEWWANYDTFAHVLWALALVSSLLFILQLASALLGGGDTESAFGDTDEYVDGDTGIGFQFFTFRNAVTFVMMLSWVGLGAYSEGNSKIMSTLYGVIAGSAMVFIMAWLMVQLNKLKQDGTMKLSNAVGKIATVYLIIPGNQTGMGKVQIVIQGSTHELDALTLHEEALPTGTSVTVTAVRPGNVLIVEKLA